MWAQIAMRKTVALETFSFRELRPTDEESERLLHRIVTSVAPNALAKWGYEKMLRACGRRPIIALFIAREIENRFEEGLLSEDELTAAGGGELSAWLRKRLAQDELAIEQPKSLWKASEPSNEMVAACGALVTTPNPSQIVVDAAAAVLRNLGSDTEAGFVARRLTEMGWLEQQGPWLTTPHDVVTDEVLDQVSRDGGLIRLGAFEALLSLWSCEPAAIGRLARALQRWIGAMPDEQAAAENAKIASAKWLRSHASEIGLLLATGDSDRTGFALGAILKWPHWSETAADCWEDLVAPWITANRQTREARHVYYMGLHRQSLASRLVAPALVWVQAWFNERGASYVLSPLLERAVVQGEELRTAVRCALAWLAQYSLEKEARYVINPLLEKDELQDEELKASVRCALAWLTQHQLEKNAQFVLRPLLERNELQGDELRAAVGCTLAWLTQHQLEKNAQFVLRSLLERNELQGDELRATVGCTLAWLAQYPLERDAQFVLRPLLERDELQDEEIRASVGCALAWLVQYPLEKNAQFVLRPLLERDELQGDELRAAVGCTLAWLGQYPLEKDAQFVLKPLLERDELQDEEMKASVKCALAWLVQYQLEKNAQFVLRPLLERDGLRSDELRPAVGCAFGWLAQYPLERDAQFVLRPLLGRVKLEEAELRIAVGYALAWLARYPADLNAGYVIAPLLTKGKTLKKAEIVDVIKHAFKWLAKHSSERDAGFVLSPLLGQAELKGIALQITIRRTLEWLGKQPRGEDSKPVFGAFTRILRRNDTPDADWLVAAKIASDWLATKGGSTTDNATIVNSLLKRPAILPYTTLQAAVDTKLDHWLSICAVGKRGPTVDIINAVEHLAPEDPLAKKVRAALG
jgi:hypothetical protein